MTYETELPFIDIAVQDTVREAMLSGSAAVLFDASIETVLWANGAAAQLFGYSATGDFMVAGVTPFRTALRQIRSLAGQNPTSTRAMMLRVTAGLGSQLVQAKLSTLTLDIIGEPAILLSIPPQTELSEDKRNHMVLAGLEEDGAGAAVIDANGSILASGSLFDGLSIAEDELSALAGEVADEDDRLVKRLVRQSSGTRAVAAGIGRLSDEPARYLVLAIETETEFSVDDMDESGTDDAGFEAVEFQTPLNQTSADAFSTIIPDEDDEDDTVIASDAVHIRPDLSRGPVRFVWKTDASGRFVDVSPEFAGAVGPNAADIIGRSFEDVSRVFELDPAGEISASMRRRDTWSGKTVLWPVQDTDLRVPVDLAALPYYNRERAFEGYRGFGIVRLGDMVVDPEELGLALADPVFGSDADENELLVPEVSEDTGEAPIDEDPFQGETPVLNTSTITPMRRDSDKILPFDRSRRVRNEPLADSEADAFRKIGQALGGKPVSEPEDIADEPADEAPVFGRRSTQVPDAPSMDLSEQDDEDDDDVDDLLDLIDDDDDGDIFEGRTDTSEDDDSEEDDIVLAAPGIPDGLDFAMAAYDRQTAPDADEEADNAGGLRPDILDGLPLPLLVVRGETAIFGNRAFGEMTGFETVEALNARGLDTLFADDTIPDEDRDERPLQLIDAHGDELNARAHLQLVPWLGSNALMFAFEPQHAQSHDEDDADSISKVASKLQSTAFDEVAEMRAILDTATDGVVVIGQDGTIRSINGSAAALFGYSDEQVAGKSFSMLFAHESQRAAMDYLSGLSDNGVASVLNEGREVLARERNGGFMPVFMTIGRLPTSNGFCAVLRDITPWKQTEQALEEARKAAEDASNIKSDFLAKISHEIRTPLNAIIGFSELMSEERFGPVGNPRYKEYLVDINKSGRHVLDLVNDLLDISKIEAGEQELDFESVSLNEAVADAITMVQPQANRNRIIVRSSMETGLPPIVADQRSIKQIVLNLLSNSIRFTHSGGQVVVTTNYTRAGSVVLRIRDTGIGMSAKEIETALQPFQQVATKGRERGDGTGLGLPLTKALVQANRAEFQINSEPGQGTVVEITFPPTRVLAE